MSIAEREMEIRIGLCWQCPECFSANVNCYESKYAGRSEDRFECQECGCMWARKDMK